ncbi:MAG TPA: DNA-3-methyladenine glycosylase [Candidatus Microsaccharimonas sp.]|nr:DNA-3-methyladenine glycosylase [Candidatus Microsaccharimonas sp.]
MGNAVDLSFLEDGSVQAAPKLIGWRLYRREGTQLVGGVIVETEAYNEHDAASHSYRGQTPRTQVMFGPAGHIYVYFTYGMHHCMNIVTGLTGTGDAVLIRALAPDEGVDIIRQRRNYQPDNKLTDGPAKICQALLVTRRDNGKALNQGEFLLLPPVGSQPRVHATARIGITKDTHRLWRFVIDN